jgi:chemotaxis signal transduction protein
MFRVGGNLLSIPLEHMHNVLRWPEHVTCLPQSPGWMLGFIKYREHNIQIADSAKIFGIQKTDDLLPGYILILGDQGWAITCDQIDKVITLEYEDVQWHLSRNNSISAGTIRDSLASLLSLTDIVNNLGKTQEPETR